MKYITEKSTIFGIKLKLKMSCEPDTGYQQICLQCSNVLQRKMSARVEVVIYYNLDLNRQFRYQKRLTRTTRI